MPANLSQLALFERPTDPAERAPKIALPFQRSEEIDVPRVCKILHISPQAVRSMLEKKIICGAYRLSNSGESVSRHWRIPYSAVVDYCDTLRIEHGISPSSVGARNLRGRRRDEDLLPFPIDQTTSVSVVADRLGCSEMAVLHLIQSGRLVAYQVLIRQPGSPWRIHERSVEQYLLDLNEAASRTPTSRRR